MLIIFRQFLLAFLVLMQFFAPLVHAHAQESALPAGLHLPEFEILATPSDHVYLHNAESALDVDSLCVSMNTGIQHKLLDILHAQGSDNGQLFWLPPVPISLPTLFSTSVIDLVILSTQQISFLVLPFFAPRAPPV